MPGRSWILAALLMAAPAPTARGADGPLIYATPCPPTSEEPVRIVVATTPRGTTVTYLRGGADPGPFETPDVNFAKVSRRLFFTLRTGGGLVEFQGHATPEALTGLLSDERGAARTIRVPLARPDAPCG